MSIQQILSNTALGAASGLGSALIGYLKREDGKEPFEAKVFVRTVLAGALVGGVAGYYGLSYDSAERLAAATGIQYYAENAVKALWRRKVKGTRVERYYQQFLDALNEIFEGDKE